MTSRRSDCLPRSLKLFLSTVANNETVVGRHVNYNPGDEQVTNAGTNLTNELEVSRGG
jgi:hypothetical protein